MACPLSPQRALFVTMPTRKGNRLSVSGSGFVEPNGFSDKAESESVQKTSSQIAGLAYSSHSKEREPVAFSLLLV
jgi:hypothetical protein